MSGVPEHAAARAWLDAQINGPARIGMPWQCLLAFLRVSTNPRVYAAPSRMHDSCVQVEEWLAQDSVWIPQPGERHVTLLTDLLRQAGMRGNLTSDAHLAALAIEHGLTLCTTDRDFARFPGLRWSNPLAEPRT